MQSLQNQRNQRKLKKMVTTVAPNSHDIDVIMADDNDEEEEKHHSPPKADVFSRLTQQSARPSTRNRDGKHAFFGGQPSPRDSPGEAVAD
jgi:hypothetical protein